MDYSYKTTNTNLGLQTTVSCGNESYSQIARPDRSTLRTFSFGGQHRITALNQRAFGDNKQSYCFFSRLAVRLEELAGASVPHTTADFEGYMNEGLLQTLPQLSAKLMINIDDRVMRHGDGQLRQISAHIERASGRWGYAADLACIVALAAFFERPATIAIYGTLATVVNVAIGFALGSWRYAPTHAIGYLPARMMHRDEILNNPDSLLAAYATRIDRLKALSESVGNATEIEQLQGEVAAHFQMLEELFTSASHQKGLVLSISDGQGSETAMGKFEKILLES